MKLILVLSFSLFSINTSALEKLTAEKSFTFNYPFKKVWNAAQISLGFYPLELNDLNSKIIKTTRLKEGEYWLAPFEQAKSSNYSQVLTFKFTALNSTQTKLTILKEAAVQKDFFGSEKSVSSEGWEEIYIFYKINREMRVKEILSKIKVSM